MLNDASEVSIREEQPGDYAAVGDLITAAFAPMPFSDGTEAAVADALRQAAVVSLALVADRRGTVVGQVMFSTALIGNGASSWHTLGPVAVAPGYQRQGIGTQMIAEGLRRLRAAGAAGCIVEGDPGYYGRFGFEPAPALAPSGCPPQFFMVLPFGRNLPATAFGFHSAFGAASTAP